MVWIVFVISIVVGSLFGYILAQIQNHEEDIETINRHQTDDFYNLCIKDAENSNRIEYLEMFLKAKYPDMDKEMMERFSKPKNK